MDVLQIPGTSQESKLSGLPEVITKVEVDPLQMVQGGTTVIKVYAPPGITMRGLLDDRTLNFFPQEYGYVALQGVDALMSPGRYPLALEGELPTGEPARHLGALAGEVDRLEAATHLGGGHAEHPREEPDVLLDGEVVVHARRLGHVADPVAQGRVACRPAPISAICALALTAALKLRDAPPASGSK